LPDAKSSKPVAADSAAASPVDPRTALAQQYLKSAATEAAEKEAAKPRAHRTPAAHGPDRPRAFSLSVSASTFAHIPLAAAILTFAALAVLWCLHLLLAGGMGIRAGQAIAVPVGFIVAVAASYVSALYLGVIESTSTGRTEVDSLAGDWRDWFWTLPATLGMLAIACFVGWFLSLGVPVSVWLLIAFCALVLYPILQLSSLETGSPLQPLSIPVLKSMVSHAWGWFVFYAVTFALVNALWALTRLAWRDPPYLTVLVMAPLVCLALLFYAWLLGQLAYLISSDKESS
jgi:hypothetical protein